MTIPSEDYPIAQREGHFVGSLDDELLEQFERAVSEGWAFRYYEGVGALLGLAKVGFHKVIAKPRGAS